MSPSLKFSSPRIEDLDTCSAIKCTEGHECVHLSPQLGNDVKVEITRNGGGVNCNGLHSHHANNPLPFDEKGTQKFSKLTKVKTYLRQIGLFLLGHFIASLYYIAGLFLLFNVITTAGFSLILRLFVRLIFAICYPSGKYRLIERGADALWAVETGFGASNSNIVIGLKCKGNCPNLEKIVQCFEKVLKFQTRVRVKKVNGAYVQEESGEPYKPYEKLKWKIVEKFFFFCYENTEKEFDVRNHFKTKEIDESADLDGSMQNVMEKCITTRMGRDIPQWFWTIISRPRTSLSRNEESEYGIVFTIHHSYGDAISWVQMLSAFADKPFKPSIDPMRKSPSLNNNTSSENFLTRVQRWCLFPHYFASQICRVWRETNFFHGPYVNNDCVCRYSCLSMKQIKEIRYSNGTTNTTPTVPVNALDQKEFRITINNNLMTMMGTNTTTKPAFTAVLSACTTAAFTKLFRDYKARVPGSVLAILPYADLPYRTLHPLNFFYSNFLNMPTNLTNSRARLVKCDKYTKKDHRNTKLVNKIMAHLCGIMPCPLQKMVGIFARATLGFSNVPGPAERFTLFDGQEVTNIILFPPLKFRTAIVVGFISYCNQLQMSICVDSTIKNHPVFASRFMVYFEEELKSLIDLNQQIGITTTTCDSSSSATLHPTSSLVVHVQSDETRGISKKSLIIDKADLRAEVSGVPSPSTVAATSPHQRDFVVNLQKDFQVPGES